MLTPALEVEALAALLGLAMEAYRTSRGIKTHRPAQRGRTGTHRVTTASSKAEQRAARLLLAAQGQDPAWRALAHSPRPAIVSYTPSVFRTLARLTCSRVSSLPLVRQADGNTAKAVVLRWGVLPVLLHFCTSEHSQATKASIRSVESKSILESIIAKIQQWRIQNCQITHAQAAHQSADEMNDITGNSTRRHNGTREGPTEYVLRQLFGSHPKRRPLMVSW